MARRQTEDSALEALQRFRRIVDDSLDMVVVFDPDGRAEYINRAFTAATGFTAGEVIGQPLRSATSMPDALESACQDTIQRGRSWHGEWEARKKSGDPYWLSMTVSLIAESNGAAERLVATGHDITERKMTEHALERSEEHFRSLVEGAADVIAVVSLDGVVQYVSPSITPVSGWRQEEVVGARMFDFVHPDDRPLLTEKFRQGIAGTKEHTSSEYRARAKDGTWRVIQSTGRMMPDRSAYVIHSRDITERKLAEQAVRESEERFRTLAEFTPAAMMIVQDSRTLYANSASEMMLEYTRDELMSMSFLEVVHPDFRERVRGYVLARQRGEAAPPQYEAKIITRSGKERWVSSSAAVIEHESRPAVLGIAFDITDRKLAEDALRESEERFRQFAENIEDVVWIADAGKSAILYVNPAFEKVWGRPHQEIYSNLASFTEVVHPDDRQIAQQMLNRTVEAAYPPELLRIVRPDGSLRWIRNRTFPIRDAAGEIRRIAGIVEDITERMVTEQALRESEARYRALYQDNPAMYFTVDEYGAVLSVNQFGAEQLGYAVDELIGRRVIDVVFPADQRTFERQLRRCLRSPEQVISWEFRKVHKSGAVMWVREMGRALSGPGGAPMVLIVCEDISGLKAMEEALQRAREELDSKVEREISEGRNAYGLTFRERSILHMIVSGNSDKEIATVLGISPRTVNKHVQRILHRMGVSSRTEASVRAVRDGIIT